MPNKGLVRTSTPLHHVLNGRVIAGAHSALRGDCTGLRGDCTGLRGDCTGLRGDCSRLWGDCTGLWGDCSDLWGDLDVCRLTAAERALGVDIDSLVASPEA